MNRPACTEVAGEVELLAVGVDLVVLFRLADIHGAEIEIAQRARDMTGKALAVIIAEGDFAAGAEFLITSENAVIAMGTSCRLCVRFCAVTMTSSSTSEDCWATRLSGNTTVPAVAQQEVQASLSSLQAPPSSLA